MAPLTLSMLIVAYDNSVSISNVGVASLLVVIFTISYGCDRRRKGAGRGGIYHPALRKLRCRGTLSGDGAGHGAARSAALRLRR